jgi:hypothetical protein
VIGRWQTTDASMLMTGVFQTGLTGERLMMFTDGTLRFYPAAGTNYSQISNFGNDVVWRGPLDANGRSGRFNVNIDGCGMNFSNEQEIPFQLRSEVVLHDRTVFTTAPNIYFRVNQRLSPVGGFPGHRAATFAFTGTDGISMLGLSAIHYRLASSGHGGWTGNGAAVKFEAGQISITNDTMDSFGVIKAADYQQGSSREVKTDIEPLTRPADVVTAARPVSYRYVDGYESQPGQRRVGLLLEDVAPHAPALVRGWDHPAKDRSWDVMGVAVMAWGAAADNADDIAALRARIEALESREVA